MKYYLPLHHAIILLSSTTSIGIRVYSISIQFHVTDVDFTRGEKRYESKNHRKSNADTKRDTTNI